MNFASSRMWQVLTLLVLAVGAGWIWVSRAPSGNASGGGITQPGTGFVAPDFTLKTSHGESITLSDLRGRPVLINVWASWCPPCRAEMPALQRVYDDYKAQGLEILAINSTNQDSEGEALAFVNELGLNFPILMDIAGEVSRLYLVQSLPTSFFIQPDGTIQEVIIGGPMSEALLRIRVEELLKE